MHILQVLIIICVYSAFAHSRAPYKITLNRIEFVHMNEEIVRGSVTTTRINRYTTGFNLIFDVKKDIPRNMKVSIKLYEFLNNEYRPFAINFVRSLCEFLEMEYKNFFYPDMVRIGAHMFEPKCPVLKGKYSMENYTLSAEHLPATLPFHNALFELKFTNGTALELSIHVYFTVDRDVLIRERYS